MTEIIGRNRVIGLGTAAFLALSPYVNANYVEGHHFRTKPPVKGWVRSIASSSLETSYEIQADKHNYVQSAYRLKDFAADLAAQSRDFTTQESEQYQRFLKDYFA